MNKYLSIIELNAKRSLWKVLIVLAVMGAAQFLLARNLMVNGRVYPGTDGQSYTSVEDIASTGTRFCICYAAAILLIFLAICAKSFRKGGSSYRPMMLEVSERCVILLNAVYNAACYFLAWAVTAMMILAAIQVYKAQPQFMTGAQHIYLRIWDSRALLNFLPLDDTAVLVSMIMITLSLGILTAGATERLSRRNFPLLCAVMIAASVLVFCFIPASRKWIMVLAGCTAFAALLDIAIMFSGDGKAHKGRALEVDDGE